MANNNILKAILGLLVVAIVGTALSFLSYFGVLLPPIEIKNVEYKFFKSMELADSKQHRAAAASLADGKIPEIEDSFGTFSQDEMRAGKGVVLTVRKIITRPFYAATDDKFYEYVTIHLNADPAAPGVYNIEYPPENGDVLAIFADGSSLYPVDACYGYPSAGTVTLEPISDGEIHVRMMLEFTNDELYGNWNKYCDKKPIDIDTVFSKGAMGVTPEGAGS